jgi:hypothetical protein
MIMASRVPYGWSKLDLPTPNARFWTWVNDGWVKLTLRPQETLTWAEAHLADEGWASEAMDWRYDGDGIHRSSYQAGRDCDGKMEWWGEDYCPLEDLAAIEATDGTLRPAWERKSASQRDYSAEAMGY